MAGYTEHAVLLGRSNSLLGIATRPDATTARPRLGIVILNTGIVHRIGHNRMYVRLARLLAAAGHEVLRFDLAGLGDSPSREGSGTTETWRLDIDEAIDWLQESTNVDGVILVGLCAGADFAVQYGYTDKRVLGVILLDPTIPPTARYYFHYVAQRLKRLSSWLSFAQGRGKIWNDCVQRLKYAVAVDSPPANSSMADPRNRQELERVYGETVGCGIKLFIVLSGDSSNERQSYREQLLEALPNVNFSDKLTLEHFVNCDHTFTSKSDRQRLNDLVLNWISARSFGRTDRTVVTDESGRAGTKKALGR